MEAETVAAVVALAGLEQVRQQRLLLILFIQLQLVVVALVLILD